VTQLQQSRYDQLLRRVGDLKGPGSKVSDALTELFPMIDVENVPPELLFLSGTLLAHGGTIVSAGAALAPRIQLFNPVGSGKIITVTTVVLAPGSTEVLRGAVTQIALTTGIGTESGRDGRLPTASTPVGEIRTDATAAFTDAQIQLPRTADLPFRLTDPNGLAVLPPGSGYEWGNGSVLSILTCSFWWKERVAQPSELNF